MDMTYEEFVPEMQAARTALKNNDMVAFEAVANRLRERGIQMTVDDAGAIHVRKIQPPTPSETKG